MNKCSTDSSISPHNPQRIESSCMFLLLKAVAVGILFEIFLVIVIALYLLTSHHHTRFFIMYSDYPPNQPRSAPPQNLNHQPPPQPQYAGRVPAHYGAPPVGNANWSSSLCDCSSDAPNCCLTCFCPCITFGQIAEILDKGNTSCGVHGVLYGSLEALTCCGCIYSCSYRTKVRIQYGLRESPCNDCLVHFFCERCALCQEYRELKHRGFDVSIGWQGNIERQNFVVQMPPMAPEGMYR